MAQTEGCGHRKVIDIGYYRHLVITFGNDRRDYEGFCLYSERMVYGRTVREGRVPWTTDREQAWGSGKIREVA